MSETTPAAWYPDPEDASRFRWWDGAQWTGHIAPSAPAQPAPQPEAGMQAGPSSPKRSRRGLVIGLTAGAMVVVLAAVAAVVWWPRPVSVPSVSAALVTDASPLYDYTEPMLDLPRNYVFRLGKDYDLRAVSDARGVKDYETDVVQVFADEALTIPVESLLFQSPADGQIMLSPPRDIEEAEGVDGAGAGVPLQQPVSPEAAAEDDGEWGLFDDYYLVRRVDQSGASLAKPVVTRFTVEHEMEPPHVNVGTTAEGDVELSWAGVDGASEYRIVRMESDVPAEGEQPSPYADYQILDTVTSTTWSSADAVVREAEDLHPDQTFYDQQNAILALFRTSAEDVSRNGLGVYEERVSFGVIAVGDDTMSPMRIFDASGTIGALPYEPAAFTNRDDGLQKVDSIGSIGSRFAFTSLDGATRRATTRLMSEGIDQTTWYNRHEENGTFVSESSEEYWQIPVSSPGMRIGFYIDVPKAAVGDLAAEIAAFNERAQVSAPTTGGATNEIVMDVAAAEIAAGEAAEAARTPPPTDYPIYGSTELTRFFAQHLIGGSEQIDASELVDKPGAPSVEDALSEAMEQNPYVIGVDTASAGREGEVRIFYELDRGERERQQRLVADGVRSVVSAVIRDDMSEAERVTALNDWLVGQVEYDYGALAAKDANGGVREPAEFGYAWEASGAFEQRKVVCGGYALAFTALANAAGVETVYVTGDVRDGGRHAWNKVKIDGVWRALDVTWNDTPRGNEYLLIPDSGFTGPAERMEDLYWMIDANIPAYATQ